MDKNDYAELEKQYSKLVSQEETLRTLKELSVKSVIADGKQLSDTDLPESIYQNATGKIDKDGISGTDVEISASMFKNDRPVADENKTENYRSLKNINEALPFFCTLKKMAAGLSKYWDVLSECIQRDDYRKANLIITSIPGNGRTTLGKLIGESVVTARRNSVRDGVLVTDAEDFNTKDIPGIYKQYVNGCILIENSEMLSKESVQSLKILTNIGEKHPLLILETVTERKNDLKEILGETAEYFTNEIEIPVMDDNTLAEFAVYYANSLEFDIDRVALLALHHQIENRQSHSHNVSLSEVSEMVDEAASHYGKNLFKKLIFSKTKHELERPVLSERDFEHI